MKTNTLYIISGIIISGGIIYYIIRQGKKMKAYQIVSANTSSSGNTNKSSSTTTSSSTSSSTTVINASVTNAFTPGWYDTLPKEGLYILTDTAANTVATKMHEALSKFNTDEQYLYDTFSKLTKSRVSQVSEKYKSLYGTQLIDDLKKELTTSEFQKIYEIVDKLRI
jgi:hypothetical protein